MKKLVSMFIFVIFISLISCGMSPGNKKLIGEWLETHRKVDDSWGPLTIYINNRTHVDPYIKRIIFEKDKMITCGAMNKKAFGVKRSEWKYDISDDTGDSLTIETKFIGDRTKWNEEEKITFEDNNTIIWKSQLNGSDYFQKFKRVVK